MEWTTLSIAEDAHNKATRNVCKLFVNYKINLLTEMPFRKNSELGILLREGSRVKGRFQSLQLQRSNYRFSRIQSYLVWNTLRTLLNII